MLKLGTTLLNNDEEDTTDTMKSRLENEKE